VSRAERRGRGAALVGLFVLGLSRGALAQPLRLELDAPAACATRESVVREVERRVEPGAREISARASIHPDRGAWVLEVEFDDGRRRLTGDSCVALAQTLTVILALAIDPSANAEPTGVSGEQESDAAASGHDPDSGASSPAASGNSAAPKVPEPRLGARRSRPRSRQGRAQPGPRKQQNVQSPVTTPLRFGVSALVLAETGALPGPTLGPGVRARLERGGWAGEVSGGYLLPRFAQLPDAPRGKGGDLSLWLVQAAACRGFLRNQLIGVCAGGEGGELVGAGRGVTAQQTGRALWTAVWLGLGAGAALGAGTYGDARLSLAVPLRRPSFGLDGFEGRYRPSAVSGRIQLGFGFR
jgi:hypothetical protein